MTNRSETEQLLRSLYAARVAGDLDGLCRLFSPGAALHFAGAGQAAPVAATATGVAEFRPLLALLIKSFKLRNQAILALIIDDARAAVHWRADIHSRIAGTTTPTEFVDLCELRDGRIAAFTEFFVTR